MPTCVRCGSDGLGGLFPVFPLRTGCVAPDRCAASLGCTVHANAQTAAGDGNRAAGLGVQELPSEVLIVWVRALSVSTCACTNRRVSVCPQTRVVARTDDTSRTTLPGCPEMRLHRAYQQLSLPYAVGYGWPCIAGALL